MVEIGTDGIMPVHYESTSFDGEPKKQCKYSGQLHFNPEYVTIETCPECGITDVTVSKSSRTISQHYNPQDNECEMSYHKFDNETGEDGHSHQPRVIESGNFMPL